jgi:tetrahydromethanopterin S-methyltransferase subunit B
MPAVDRLAKEVFDQATQVAKTYPNEETYKLVRMTANLYYGTQIGLAFINRGAKGVRARQLLDDYESTVAWMDMETGGTW